MRDFNGDHRVNSADLNILGQDWQATQSTISVEEVSEPASFVYAAIFLTFLPVFCRMKL